MYKVLALDVGQKRIGVAISDFLCIASSEQYLVIRDEKAVEEIKNLCRENHVKKIVVGLPLNMDGTMGEQAKDCQNFAKNFDNFEDIEIIFEDERLTSVESEEILSRSRRWKKNRKFKKKKGLIDMYSASIILNQYLSR